MSGAQKFIIAFLAGILVIYAAVFAYFAIQDINQKQVLQEQSLYIAGINISIDDAVSALERISNEKERYISEVLAIIDDVVYRFNAADDNIAGKEPFLDEMASLRGHYSSRDTTLFDFIAAYAAPIETLNNLADKITDDGILAEDSEILQELLGRINGYIDTYSSESAGDGYKTIIGRIDSATDNFKQELIGLAIRKAREEQVTPPDIPPEDIPDMLPGDSSSPPQEFDNVDDYAAEILRLTNEQRAAFGLAPLTADNDILTQAALIRANEIVRLWSHTRPDGRSCFTAYTDLDGKYLHLGENLAMGQKTPEDAVTAWMNSTAGHREAILNPDFTQLGVGVVRDSNGRYYWSQMFCG